jgi:hypothetical protein
MMMVWLGGSEAARGAFAGEVSGKWNELRKQRASRKNRPRRKAAGEFF